jgi:hypothetical protein
LNAGNWTSVSIQANAVCTISGATTAGNPLIDFNGADNISIDGVNATCCYLTISNTTASGVANTSTIRFRADATNISINNCTISGSATNTAGGTIFFSTGTTSGNDGISIQNCIINAAGSNLPVNAIYSAGSSTGVDNSGISITNNSIQDYYNAASSSNGIYIASNSSAWTITGNSFFQTATRTATAGNTHRAINIVTPSGNGYVISSNIIGYANSGGTGMTMYDGAYANCFVGIELTASTSSTSSIQGNTISGISLSTTSGAATPPGIFTGISILAGLVNIGTTSGNTIGATSGAETILINSTTDGGYIAGVYSTSSATVNIQNNTIGAITAGGAAAVGYSFYGIHVAGNGNPTVLSNSVGNASAANISIGTTGITTAPCYLYGVYSTSTGAITIGSTGSGNIIRNLNNNSSGTGTIQAIFNSGAVTGTNSISFNSIDNLCFTAISTASTCYLINNTGAANTSTLNITDNTFGSNCANYTGTIGGSGAFYGIYQIGAALYETIRSNNFNNIALKSSGTVLLIWNNYTAPANGTKTIQDNFITTGFNRTVAINNSSNFYCYDDWGNSPVTATLTISGNNFSGINCNTTGTGSFYGIFSADGLSVTKNVYNNTLSNISYNGNLFYGFYLRGFSGTSGSPNLLYGNFISNVNCNGGSGSVIEVFEIQQAQYLNAYNNTIQNLTLTVYYFYGMNFYNCTMVNIHNNTISGISNLGLGDVFGISSSSTQVAVYQNSINSLSGKENVSGIYVTGGTTADINQHQVSGINNYSIYGLTSSGTSYSACGIKVTGGTTVNVYKNSIYNISNSSAGNSVPLVHGMLFSGGTTVNAYNNLIGNLTAPLANYTDAVRGISLTSTTASTSYNIFYNTLYLNATSSGVTFGTTGIYHTTSSTATTANLNLRNNIIINKSTPNGTGLTVAYRRSDATLTNYGSASNNNIFYAGTPGASRLIFNDGTNSDQTLATYQARVAPRDANSFTEDVNFLSTAGFSNNFLHIDAAFATQAESGAVNIASFTDDFDGNIRQGNTGYTGTGAAPDIGADEGEFTNPKTWNGSVSDNWNNALNWTPNGVPTLGNDVKIASGTTFPCIIRTTDMLCKNIVINNGASLTLNSSSDITVNGNLTIEAGGIFSNDGTLHLKGNMDNQNP